MYFHEIFLPAFPIIFIFIPLGPLKWVWERYQETTNQLTLALAVKKWKMC